MEMYRSDGMEINALALHGYGQTNTDLARSMTRLFKAPSRLIYPTAPVTVSLSGREGRAWWSRPTMSLDDSFAYAGFEESCAAVRTALGDTKVEAVVGFSQGAVMATLLLQKGLLPDCRCAVLFGASGVQDPDLADLAIVRDVSALIMHGERDALCSIDDARRLGASYEDASYVTHRWGHVVPSDAATRDAIAAFVRQACDSK